MADNLNEYRGGPPVTDRVYDDWDELWNMGDSEFVTVGGTRQGSSNREAGVVDSRR